jgi:hypothetical protein
MICDDQIPDESVAAAASEYTAQIYKGNATTAEFRAAVRSAIAAALNAWQGMEMRPTLNPSRIILPLPQENTDD